LFPVNGDDLWNKLFAATYRSHGGSGSNLTLTEAFELDWSRMEWWYEQVEEYRKQEAAAIRRANTRSGRRSRWR
jgi:hypothetical protein